MIRAQRFWYLISINIQTTLTSGVVCGISLLQGKDGKMGNPDAVILTLQYQYFCSRGFLLSECSRRNKVEDHATYCRMARIIQYIIGGKNNDTIYYWYTRKEGFAPASWWPPTAPHTLVPVEDVGQHCQGVHEEISMVESDWAEKITKRPYTLRPYTLSFMF